MEDTSAPSPAAATTPDDTLTAALARHNSPSIRGNSSCSTNTAACCGTGTKSSTSRGTRTTKNSSAATWSIPCSLRAHLRQGEEVLDVGTGGGVPGVVLAILRPDLKVTLCDSVGKKARAVESIVKDLGLEMPVFPFRAEELLEDTRYDALVIRAVGPLWKLLAGFKPHWHSFRRMLVIKGPKWTEELNEASRRGLMHNLQLKTAAEYPLPGADGNSVILKIWPKNVPER